MHERRYNINSILGFEATRVGGGNGRSGHCDFFCDIAYRLLFNFSIADYLHDNKGVS